MNFNSVELCLGALGLGFIALCLIYVIKRSKE